MKKQKTLGDFMADALSVLVVVGLAIYSIIYAISLPLGD